MLNRDGVRYEKGKKKTIRDYKGILVNESLARKVRGIEEGISCTIVVKIPPGREHRTPKNDYPRVFSDGFHLLMNVVMLRRRLLVYIILGSCLYSLTLANPSPRSPPS